MIGVGKYGIGVGKYDAPGTVHRRFASLTETVEAARKSPDWTNGYADDHADFAGATAEGAAALALYGWPEGAREASILASKVVQAVIAGTGNALVMQMQSDVCGACYDVGAYCSGEPECWIRPEPTLTKRAISIGVNAGASGGVPASALRNRGIAIASLVLALQTAGYPVTVDVFEVSHSGYSGAQSFVTRITDATGSPLDIDRLVYSIGHPSMLRQIIANAYGQYHQWGHATPDSDGKPEGYSFDLCIGGCHLYDTDRWVGDRATAWVMEEFKRQTA